MGGEHPIWANSSANWRNSKRHKRKGTQAKTTFEAAATKVINIAALTDLLVAITQRRGRLTIAGTNLNNHGFQTFPRLTAGRALGAVPSLVVPRLLGCAGGVDVPVGRLRDQRPVHRGDQPDTRHLSRRRT